MFIRRGFALRSHLLTFCIPFFNPFPIPSIDKWCSFHILCLELFIPFNCCKCTKVQTLTTKGLQRTANEYAEERRIYKDLIYFLSEPSLFVTPYWRAPEGESCLWLQSRSVLSSFGVVLMSCRVNFHVVRSALQYSACRI